MAISVDESECIERIADGRAHLGARADVPQQPTIERCLQSVPDQEGVEFDFVPVDDCSSDDSAAIAARMLRPGDRLIRNESRVGLNQNHNKCLAPRRNHPCAAVAR
jgi:glycosyltransferase involved in cell wall biosynthesis